MLLTLSVGLLISITSGWIEDSLNPLKLTNVLLKITLVHL